MGRCDDKVNLDFAIVRVFAIADAVLRGSLVQLLNRLAHKHATKSKRGRHYNVRLSPELIAELRIEDKWSWSRNLTATMVPFHSRTSKLLEFIVCDITHVRGFIFLEFYESAALIHHKFTRKRKESPQLAYLKQDGMFLHVLFLYNISTKITSVRLISVLRHCSNISRVSTIE